MVDRQSIYSQGTKASNPWLQRVIQTPFNNTLPAGAILTVNEQVSRSFTSIFVEKIESPCIISVGSERQYKLGRFEPGDQVSFALPSPVDIIYVDYTNKAGLQFTAAGGVPLVTAPASINPSVTVWLADEIIFFARNDRYGRIKSEYLVSAGVGFIQNNLNDDIIDPDDTLPLVDVIPHYMNTADVGFRPMGNASAASPFSHSIGAQSLYSFPEDTVSEINAGSGIPRPKRGVQRMFLDTYTGILRTGAHPRTVSAALGAGAITAIGSLTCASNSVRVRLRRVLMWILSLSAASVISIELWKTTGSPVGTAVASANHEGTGGSPSCTLTRVPTGLTNVGNPYTVIPLNLGITGAASAANPPPKPETIVLYDDTFTDGAMPLSLQGDNVNFNGFGLFVDASIATTLGFIAQFIWTEHNIFV